MLRIDSNLQFAVLGLGRFGMSIVKTLAQSDVNILACDKDSSKLHEAAEYATHVVQADAEDAEAMRKLGLGNFDVVVFAMGGDFEATINGTMVAKELGAAKVVVRAFSTQQKKILVKLGADQVVLPEVDMGTKLAWSFLNPNIIDVLEQTTRQTIIEMRPDKQWVGHSILQLRLREKYGHNVLAVIRDGEAIFPVTGATYIEEEDILIVLSETDM